MTASAGKNDRAVRQEWVAQYLANLLGIDRFSVDLTKELADYGLDSADAVIMASEFEKNFSVEIDPTIFFECSNLQQMIDALSETAEANASAASRRGE